MAALVVQIDEIVEFSGYDKSITALRKLVTVPKARSVNVVVSRYL